jgi:tripartite-type tricarboxylate transporter receptor subunit TctC
VTLYEKNPVTITRDIMPVASINDAPFVLEVNPSFPVKNVAEFIAYAKAHPGKINLASGPPGQMTHLCGELLRMMTGIDIVPVPFRGPPAAQSAVIAGDAHGMFDAVGASLPLIQAGSLRALGVTASARLRVLPDTPFIADTVPGYTVTAFLGVGAPTGTPPEIIELLNREVNAVLSDPTVKTRMAELGADIVAGSPADFGKLIIDETDKWAKVVKFAGIKAG